MSRFIDRIDENTYETTVESMDICKWRYNEVCCNSKSEHLADYPPYKECRNNKYCMYFEKEDGKVEKVNE